MKRKKLASASLILILFLSILAYNYLKSKNRPLESNRNSQPIQNLSGAEISRLNNDVTVRFPATLVKRFGSNCIELFSQDDFKKYEADSKHAISSRFAFEPHLADQFWRTNNVIVTGKMTFLRNVSDTTKTCGIFTGHIFEITEIEYF